MNYDLLIFLNKLIINGRSAIFGNLSVSKNIPIISSACSNEKYKSNDGAKKLLTFSYTKTIFNIVGL